MSVDPAVRSTERRKGKAGCSWGDGKGQPAQRSRFCRPERVWVLVELVFLTFWGSGEVMGQAGSGFREIEDWFGDRVMRWQILADYPFCPEHEHGCRFMVLGQTGGWGMGFCLMVEFGQASIGYS